MASLAEIRAKLKEQENRSSGNTSSGGDNAIYPFWNMSEGSSATLRFLPDGNPNADFFWAERLMIKLPFAGVKAKLIHARYKYKFLVWKCMANRVQFLMKYAVGLKIHH
jgi:hypothetical protein